MDIKRAKQEIEHAVKAYLAVDDTGTPLIPPIRQRPILLMGPPGVGKTRDHGADRAGMRHCAGGIHHHPPHPPKRRGPAIYSATAILAARTAA